MTDADIGSPLVRQWRGRRLAGVAVVLGLFTYIALDRWGRDHLFLINTTTSLPNWAFLVDRVASPTRGKVVFFVPRDSALLRRHFGAHPAPFGKIVYGVGGDVVARRGRIFFVNGVAVARAKPQTLRGEPLIAGPVGILPHGCFFVGTPNPDSFDSRYAAIGWICRDRVVGVGEPIL